MTGKFGCGDIMIAIMRFIIDPHVRCHRDLYAVKLCRAGVSRSVVSIVSIGPVWSNLRPYREI